MNSNGNVSGKKDGALIFFCRPPGRGKTRLAAVLGRPFAAGLYSCFLKDLSSALRGCGRRVLVFHSRPGSAAGLRGLLGAGFSYLPQSGGDLGVRMRNAFRKVFSLGFSKAVLIGSDVPDLDAAELRNAFVSLGERGAVIGPALDGGYYLLGFRREAFNGGVFSGIDWGTARVFAQTMKRFKAAGCPPLIGRLKSDIDTFSDLKAFYERNAGSSAAPRTMRELAGLEERF